TEQAQRRDGAVVLFHESQSPRRQTQGGDGDDMNTVMNELFLHAVEVVLEHEGGYVHDPHDPGGETKFGISKRQYPDLDIANLTREQAIEIYRRDWWDKYGYGRLT